MFRRMSLLLRILTPVALCACLVVTPATGAAPPKPPGKPPAKPDPNTKLDPKKMAEEIKKHGKLAGSNYWHLAEARHPGKKQTVAAKPFQKPKAGAAALVANGGSSLTTVGGDGMPTGFNARVHLGPRRGRIRCSSCSSMPPTHSVSASMASRLAIRFRFSLRQGSRRSRRTRVTRSRPASSAS